MFSQVNSNIERKTNKVFFVNILLSNYERVQGEAEVEVEVEVEAKVEVEVCQGVGVYNLCILCIIVVCIIYAYCV